MNKNILIPVLAAVLIVGWFVYDKNTGDKNPTSADNAPPGSLHNLPVPEAVAKVRAKVANELEIDQELVIVESAYERDWPNSCFGLELPKTICAQVIIPGYEVTVKAEGKTFTYRTNLDGNVILLAR